MNIFQKTELPLLRKQNKTFATFCVMIFFWTLFEGSVGYVAPLKIIQSGFSETFMGILIGSSSVFGALFDFFLSTTITNMHYRRIFLVMFALSAIFPFFLWKGTFSFYVVAMLIWGIYYDLFNFGMFDFVGRKSLPEEHSQRFGFIEIFRALAYIIAPLCISFVISIVVPWQPFILMSIFLLFSFLFFLFLLKESHKKQSDAIPEKSQRVVSLTREITLWKIIGKALFPVLILTSAFNLFDSFFWTIGPILAQSYKALNPFNGLFLACYSIPPLIVGWFIGGLTKRFGKKRLAFFSFGIGALLLSGFSLIHNPFLILLIVFCVGIFTNISLPAIEGAYADYISETAEVEREITSLIDFCINIGFILGPIMAGFLADRFGNAQAFSLLGLMTVFICVILLITTPKHIRLRIR